VAVARHSVESSVRHREVSSVVVGSMWSQADELAEELWVVVRGPVKWQGKESLALVLVVVGRQAEKLSRAVPRWSVKRWRERTRVVPVESEAIGKGLVIVKLPVNRAGSGPECGKRHGEVRFENSKGNRSC
jgi:hypothetical protein